MEKNIDIGEAKIEFNSEMAEKYSAMIRTTIPGYDDMHQMALSLLQNSAPENARVLVVGAGDGQEILGLKKTRPSWSVTGVDPSAEMLAVAKARLAEKGLDAELFAGSVSSVPKAEPFDAATSILVMHFVKEPAEKLEFLRNISDRLKKGGAYVHVELCDDNKASPALPDMQTVWNHFQISKGHSEADLIDRNKRRANSVFTLPPDSVEKLFSEAGFSGARLFYKALNFHGWIMAQES